MKTQRRHELQTNQLADTLARWIERIKPYGRVIAGMLAVLLALIFTYFYVSRSSSERVAAGWDEYFQATAAPDSVRKLQDTIKNHPDDPVGEWAKLLLAEIQLAEGTGQLFKDKSEAADRLTQATDNFSGLKDAKEPTLRQRALYGLARANEARGRLDTAREHYTTLAEAWPDGPYAKLAARRVEELKKGEAEDFYRWLAEYVPPPAARNLRAPGTRPGFDDESLDPTSTLPPVPRGPFSRTPSGDEGAMDDDEMTPPDDGSTEPAASEDESGSDDASSDDSSSEDSSSSDSDNSDSSADDSKAGDATAPEKPSAKPSEKPAADQPKATESDKPGAANKPK